ncbi:adaptor protein MecA, partial [Staphylococcus epidermidis]|uniref:adaptor protein MecA n=1 Tax=Staphylococcus epidermidis TaxID=1282 RepID=UPI0037D9CEE4
MSLLFIHSNQSHDITIQPVHHTTLKFFITYSHIQPPPFTPQDLCTNPKRPEQFFSSMIHQINEEHHFLLQPPLSIQLHPFQNRFQVTISKSKNQHPINISHHHTNHQFHHHLNQ